LDNFDNVPVKGFTVGKLLKYLLIAVILLVYGIFMLRICTMGNPTTMDQYVWTESTVQLYKTYQDKFAVEKVNEETLSYQYITTDGKFAINSIFVTETGNGKAQVQFTIRYNNSTLEALRKDYNLIENPTGEPFVYILNDINGNIYRKYQFTTDTKSVYNYRHIIFEDVDISGMDYTDLFYINLDIYYIEDVNFANISYGTLPVLRNEYDSEGKYNGYLLEPYDIKKDLFKKDSPTSGITPSPAYLVKE
jgi:hypothetical protein